MLAYVRLAATEKAPVRAVKDAKGGSHTVGMTAGIVATSVLFFPQPRSSCSRMARTSLFRGRGGHGTRERRRATRSQGLPRKCRPGNEGATGEILLEVQGLTESESKLDFLHLRDFDPIHVLVRIFVPSLLTLGISRWRPEFLLCAAFPFGAPGRFPG